MPLTPSRRLPRSCLDFREINSTSNTHPPNSTMGVYVLALNKLHKYQAKLTFTQRANFDPGNQKCDTINLHREMAHPPSASFPSINHAIVDDGRMPRILRSARSIQCHPRDRVAVQSKCFLCRVKYYKASVSARPSSLFSRLSRRFIGFLSRVFFSLTKTGKCRMRKEVN